MAPGRAVARSFSDLIVWQKAHAYALAIYRLSGTFSKHETYGLAQQMRRAAVSVPANIAEGFRKRGSADKVRFMNIAEGSLEESRYYLILAKDLGYADTDVLMERIVEISKLLQSYSKAILNSSA